MKLFYLWGHCVHVWSLIPILGWYLGVSLWSERWDKYNQEANEDITVISVVSVIRRLNEVLSSWFSTFSMLLQPFHMVPHVAVSPNQKNILLLLHNYNFDTVMKPNANIWYAGYLIFYTQSFRATSWETPTSGEIMLFYFDITQV